MYKILVIIVNDDLIESRHQCVCHPTYIFNYILQLLPILAKVYMLKNH